MNKKTIILVDGQNLYYSLKACHLTEKNIIWDKFFSSLLEPNDELIRSYWFRPHKLHEPHLKIEYLENYLIRKRFKPNKEKIKELITDRSLIPSNIIEEAKKKFQKSIEWIKVQVEDFKRQCFKYDQLVIEFNNIKIIKKGIVKINPYGCYYVGEKGVDITLAVKMIELSEMCDKIILISGDLDYGEAIKYVQNKLKTVHIVKIYSGNPPQNRSVAKELIMIADQVIDVYESEIKEKYYQEDPTRTRKKDIIASDNGK